MKIKAALLAILIAGTATVPAYGTTAHEQAMSYILYDQDAPREPGDLLYTEQDNEGRHPMLVETTGYHRGTHGSHGDRMRKGYVAYTQESYGYAMEIYEAVRNEDGTYSIGEYIGLYEIKDTGFGRETGKGRSRVRSDKRSQGSIEAGLSVDVYHPSLSECKEWMKLTNGMVFVQLIPNVKG